MGRRPHTPDPFHGRQVEALAAYGVPETDIARVLAIDPKTLRKYYREELDTGSVKATAKVAEFLFRKATTEGPQCITAAIFWLKTRGGWRETPHDHRVGIVDLTSLSDAELMRIATQKDTGKTRGHAHRQAVEGVPASR
jgi:hypothetical protein